MGSTIIEQDFPYDILRRGSKDASRHNHKVKEAARKQIKDIISQQDIISSENNKKVKIRLKDLHQYRFIHNRDRIDNIGRDEFDEFEKDEIITRPRDGDSGSPDKAGQDVGQELFEAEFTIEQLTDMMMEELKLPDFEEKKRNEIVSDVVEFTDIRKKYGEFACVDRKRTILANILRKSQLKKKWVPIIDEDLRFRTWEISQQKHSNAVVFLQMDRSGSMNEEKIYAVKALYFWIVQFLKRKYDRVEIKFISHDWVAREMSEKDFFMISPAGGTKISSAYELCRDIIKHNYPSSIWNIYCFHASDGDSYENDEDLCVEIIQEILNMGASLFAYTEIHMDEWRENNSDLYVKLESESKNEYRILVSKIYTLKDILETLKLFLRNSVRKTHAIGS